MELLCALDVPLRAQVAEGVELLPPAGDGALVDVEDPRNVAIGQLGRLQKVHQDVLFVLVETAAVGFGHGAATLMPMPMSMSMSMSMSIVVMSGFADESSGVRDLSRPRRPRLQCN